MKEDNSHIFKDKNHYERISERIKNINNKLAEERNKHEKNNKKKRKNKNQSDIEIMLFEKTFETEALPKEYLKIMYKEKTGHLPNEEQYNNLLHDLKSKGYVFSENGKPYEPKYDSSKTDKENFQRFRKEWSMTKNNIEKYLEKNL